jgi:hypothetical protein
MAIAEGMTVIMKHLVAMYGLRNQFPGLGTVVMV